MPPISLLRVVANESLLFWGSDGGICGAKSVKSTHKQRWQVFNRIKRTLPVTFWWLMCCWFISIHPYYEPSVHFKLICFLSYRYAVIAFGCASCPKITCGREGCGTEFCYHCKQLWHPNQTCDAARQQRAQSLRLRPFRSSSLSYSQESGAAGEFNTHNIPTLSSQ